MSQTPLEASEITWVNSLFCRSIGEGPPIIVIHGGPGLTHEYLLPEFTELAKNHQLIFYDQRGCGRSADPFDQKLISMEQYIEDIDVIRKEFGFERISILGHSWGGFVALHYTLAHPENIEKLILSNCIPVSSEEDLLYECECMKRLAPFQEELDQLIASQGFMDRELNSIEMYFHILGQICCYDSEMAGRLNFKLSSDDFLYYQKVKTIFHDNLFAFPYSLHQELNKIDIPTLIIHGDYDPIPLSTAEKIHQSIPHSEFILMKQCGHFPHLEDPESYMNHINRFL